MKSKKICLKKNIIIIWGILAAILLASALLTIAPYSKYKKGQEWAIACMLVATDEFDEYKDDKKKLIEELYDYFNVQYYSINTDYGTIDNKAVIEARDKVEESLEELLRKEGYDEGWKASHYFEYTNYFGYYFYKNYVFSFVYAIAAGIYLILNIIYILIRREEITVNENIITYKKVNGKTKEFMIKDITSAETITLKGLKLSGNGIKVTTLLLENNEKLKDYIVKLIPEKKSNEVTTNISAADELAKYKKLLDSGAITQEEYDKKKEKILDL